MATVPQSGEPVAIPLNLFEPPIAPASDFEQPHDTPHDTDGLVVQSVELITAEAFADQWGMIHEMAGGMVQMRTGAPCPLGDQARSEGGRVACNAAYQLILSNPTLARMLLSPESSFWGQMAAIGMHGFACLQLVKASQTGATLPEMGDDHADG